MKIGIVGSGTMGAGIAQVASEAGNEVLVFDVNQDMLLKAKTNLSASLEKLVAKGKRTQQEANDIQNSIQWIHDMSGFKPCELIIEAIVERIDIKQKLFQELESIVSADCMLASNTSSLSITSIASACKNPERVIGIHFFNPAPLMALVEIVPALQTNQQTIEHSKQIITTCKKICVLAKDTPGFIVNRIARPYYSEAIRMYEEGNCYHSGNR